MSSPPPTPSESDLTRFLSNLGGEAAAPDSGLMRYVYDELRKTAEAYMRQQRASASLQPTALVHDAFLKIFRKGPVDWNGRVHFFALAAKAMRQILVNHARARKARRQSPISTHSLDEGDAGGSGGDGVDLDLLDLDEALQALGIADERAARVVELRYFGGLSIEDTATAMGLSHATVERDWATARAWLGRRLSGHRAS